MQREVIQLAHKKGHFGVRITKYFIRRTFFIVILEEEMRIHIDNCVTCIVSNRKLGKKDGELHPLHKGAIFLNTYNVDFLKPLESTSKLYKHRFTVIDSLTICIVIPVRVDFRARSYQPFEHTKRDIRQTSLHSLPL